MHNRLFYGFQLIVVTLLCIPSVYSQNDSISGTSVIEYYIEKNLYQKADSTLNAQIAHFKNNNQIDSLYQFPIYIGKVALLKNDAKLAASKAQKFIDNVISPNTSNTRTLYKSYLSMDDLYYDLIDDENCVIASKKALEYAKLTPDITSKELGNINYIIGGNYYSLYDLSNALSYFKASAKAYEKSKTVKKHKLADSYNGIAVSMWTLNKLDSAEVYFNKAIKATQESDLEGFDKIYYIYAFKFNLALVIDDSGNIDEAIAMKKEIIKNLQDIINGSKDKALVEKSKGLLASAISNIAAFYNDIGFVTKAYEMLKYAYDKKKSIYEPTHPKLATALLQIATSEIELRDFDKAIKTLEKGLRNLRASKSKYPAVEAELIHLQARAYTEKEDIQKALYHFQESEQLYNEAYPKDYSRSYLILLRDYSMFLATNNQKEKAIAIAKRTYTYILNNGGDDNFPLLKEILNLANVYFKSGDFENSKEWAEKGRVFLDNKLNTANSAMDSLQIAFRKPTIMLLESKSKYKLAKQKTTALLIQLTQTLDDAIAILEKRKATIFNPEDISAVLSESKTISDFSKQLNLELYQLTNDKQYLSKIIELHEANIYNKIRTRLALKHNVNFANIPQTVLKRERDLKTQLTNSLKEGHSDINAFFNAERSRQQFVDTLKNEYPKYYKMRYATIDASIDHLQRIIEDHTTLIRYLYIENTLYAFIISKSEKHIVTLETEALNERINTLNNNLLDIDTSSQLFYRLYQQLWLPFETKIQTKHVIIVPDGQLFNLSFEFLTPNQISSFSEMATSSLLAKYTISYNFSLLLINSADSKKIYNDNIIAFAPEFNSKMKSDYQLTITDSIHTDKTYLRLLPQPFTKDLAKLSSKVFSGESFLNEKASKQIFTEQAKEHKIIHIGTHAESNNISPELSRLIFAKNINDSIATEDNSLYTYEIYNQNLSSNLAILTACETGKPSHQSGEGMISLAHAFNYAGSESMLTSLWKIDEQSSAQIIESFYHYLKEGLPKDQALQKAKLDYIATAQGRTRAPQYWAGLVLIGDTAPIDLSRSSGSILFWILGVILIIIVVAVLKRKKSN